MKIARTLLALFGLVLLCARLAAVDASNVATFDYYVISPDDLFFEEDASITPDKTFIVLRNFRALSSPSGERFALITVQNQLNSRQSLDKEEFVGVFADGTRRYPKDCDIKLDPARTRTVLLEFGAHPLPLVKIVIDNGKS